MDSFKEKRIEIRSSEEEKKKFEEAASLMHMGLSEFIRFATHMFVKKVHEEHQTLNLSREASLAFFRALDAPPEPNDHLIEAMRHYRENTQDESI